MEFKNEEEALEYLRNLDVIIMPSEFTYFNHCTSYQAEAIQATKPLKKSWTEIPIDGFKVRGEMSFVERTERIKEALEYGGVERANVHYAMPTGAKPFIIRVIMPKKHLSPEDKLKLDIDDAYYQKLFKEHMGLRDNRHPKLGSGEHILMFASSTKDEVSGKEIDILYGVREQDVIRYANRVREVLSIQIDYPESVMPVATRVHGEAFYEWDDNYQFEREIYSIPRDKSFRRYIRPVVLDNNGQPSLYQSSEFEQEYFKELVSNYTFSSAEDAYNAVHHK